MQVKHFVNTVCKSNTFLICGKGQKCFLVDCGDTESVILYLRQNELILEAVFITHTHYDHIYGLNELFKEYPNLIVYTSLHGQEGLYSDKLNLSKYIPDSFVFQSNNVSILKEGDELQLFDDVTLKIYETPGHDWSSVSYQIGNIFFTGDSYLPQHNLVVNFPKSDKKKAFASLNRIKNLSAGCIIYPGHGDIMCR